MTQDPIDARLAAIDGGFRKAEKPAEYINANELPAGTYQGEIQQSRLAISKKSDRLQMELPIRVIAGEHKDSIITRYDGLQSEQNFGYVKQLFSRLGLGEPKTSFQIKELLPKVEGLKIEFAVRQKDGFTNIFINKLLAATDVAPQRKML